MKIGFIGLGIMGKPMAKNLIKAGYDLTVYDLNADAMNEVAACGCKKAESIHDAAAVADVLITMVPNSPQVKQVLLAEGGAIETLRRGAVVIDCSSINPIASREVAAALAEKGIEMLDAPVSGGEPKAIDGTLAFMVGGKQEVFDQYKEILSHMGSSMVLCGGIAIIVLVSHLLMKHLVGRLQASDERRVAVFAQMEHNQKLSSIGRLAAGVAHEVNNPLAVIYEKAGLALDFLRMSKDCASYEKHRERILALLESIEGTVERARGITHRLLGFSRRMEANRQSLRLAEVITESSEFLEREAKNRGVQLCLDLPGDLPEIVSDRGQLQQIFLNILGNALDAVSDVEQGGRIEVSCSCPDKASVAVSVKDNGKGMPPDVLKHIFEPFYSTKKDKGTGLGMFITYGIVRRLGGDIVVESEEGRGSLVRITLPLTPPEGAVEV